MLILQEETVKTLLNNNKDYKEWTKILNELLPKYSINTPKRIAMFIAQTGHESADYTRLTENLNYSEQGLLLTFPKYFTKFTAKLYARNPQKIANLVYANRMGNGDEKSGDGWKFRGKGILQITGKYNHKKFADYIKKPLEETLEYLLTKQGAVEAACWFWSVNNLNKCADNSDVTTATKIINGGSKGLQDRLSRYNRIIGVIS